MVESEIPAAREERKEEEPIALGDSSDVTDTESEELEDFALTSQAADEEESKQDAQTEHTAYTEVVDAPENIESGDGAAKRKRRASQDEDDVDEDQKTQEIINRYTVDIIAEHKDFGEELALHWAVAKQNAGEWTRPDDAHLPRESTRWSDNVAVQTLFERNSFYPEYRTLQFVFKWID